MEIVKTKENASKFVKFSRPSASDGRVLWASDSRIVLWQLSPLQQHAGIESIEPGALNIDFGGDENEVIVFHAWNTKLTIYSLDTGRSQIIKTPKSSHYNNFGYRPNTRQFAIILKPDANDLLTIHEFRSYELVGRAILPTVDAQGLKWSPDGRWIAIWDAASTGTKVLIYTADGQPFRTYTGPPELDDTVDLGVKNIQWSPVSPNTGASEYLAVGKVDGTIDLLKNKTVRRIPGDYCRVHLLIRLVHMFHFARTCRPSRSEFLCGLARAIHKCRRRPRIHRGTRPLCARHARRNFCPTTWCLDNVIQLRRKPTRNRRPDTTEHRLGMDTRISTGTLCSSLPRTSSQTDCVASFGNSDTYNDGE